MLSDWSSMSVWTQSAVLMVGWGVSAAVSLLFIDAPYGKFAPDKSSIWGPLVPARWGWVIQESPSIILMLLYWFQWGQNSRARRHAQTGWAMAERSGEPGHAAATPNQVLAGMFCFHYFFRSWVFPFLLNQGKPVPLGIVAMAFGFCVWNGWMQGSYLFEAGDTAPEQYARDWLALPRVQAGIALFALGWAANQHADYVLRHLRDAPPAAAGGRSAASDPAAKARKDGADSAAAGPSPSSGASASSGSVGSRYRVPYGGLFRFTSAANYTAEIIEWGGFALAAWSVPATAFWLFTILNLAPRAVSYHRWYKQNFPNYPKDRKAVIPFIL